MLIFRTSEWCNIRLGRKGWAPIPITAIWDTGGQLHKKDKHFLHVDDDVIVTDMLITWWALITVWDSGVKFMTSKFISVNILQFRIFCVSDKHEIADMGWSPADTRIIVRLPRSLLIKKWCGELLTIIINNSNQRFPATAALIIRGKLDNSN